MSNDSSEKTFPNDNEKTNEKKPIVDYFIHLSDLDLDSKKHITAMQIEHNYKHITIFDTKNQNINGFDFFDEQEEDQFLNNRKKEESKSKSNIVINSSLLNESNQTYLNNNISKTQNFNIQQQNKKLLRKPQKKRQKKNNNKNNKKNGMTRKNKSLINASKSSISSKRSNSSKNSTKRDNYLLNARNSPEKYPEDYLSIDSSSDSEKEEKQRKEIQINENCTSLFYKKISDKGNNINTDSKTDIKNKLEGFELTSVDMKSMFRNEDFKKKYFKNFKKEIIITFFDKEQKPLHAIFVFSDLFENKRDIEKNEKKLFPGAYDRDEFTEFCSSLFKTKNPVNVELLMDFAEMSKYNELSFIGINPDLLNDFYFLVNIF